MTENYLHILARITTFVFDVDGVLTDGSLILLPSGDQVRTMNTRDGYALKLAISKGYRVAIITGGHSEAVRRRLAGLGIHDVYIGVADKVETLDEYLLTYDLSKEEVLYMGDDLPDYEVMREVALPCCPRDASEEIKGISTYISSKNGGGGCVRDIIERTMRLHGKWFEPAGDTKNLAEHSGK